jgi:hypothetical protein
LGVPVSETSGNIMVHAGYRRAWLEAKKDLWEPLLEAAEKYPDYHIFFTGLNIVLILGQ